MPVLRLATVVAGALALAGCIPVYQSNYVGSAGLSRAASYDVMYGSGRSAGSAGYNAVAFTRVRPTENLAKVYSAEWQKLEAEREARLKQSSAICRC
jgi:hypothetical protein